MILGEVSPVLFCIVHTMRISDYQFSIKWFWYANNKNTGMAVLTCLNVLTLSHKPGKEGKIDYSIIIYSDFSSIRQHIVLKLVVLTFRIFVVLFENLYSYSESGL